MSLPSEEYFRSGGAKENLSKLFQDAEKFSFKVLKTTETEKAESAGLKNSVSIAVLPFDYHTSGIDTEYLANGSTESLIDNLAQIPQLRVIAYSAVRNYKTPSNLQNAGFLLGAEKILTGSISLYEDNVEINVELIETADKHRL